MTAVGTRMARHEDPRLLRGRGPFGDDISAVDAGGGFGIRGAGQAETARRTEDRS